jgi:hypothetical protein
VCCTYSGLNGDNPCCPASALLDAAEHQSLATQLRIHWRYLSNAVILPDLHVSGAGKAASHRPASRYPHSAHSSSAHSSSAHSSSARSSSARSSSAHSGSTDWANVKNRHADRRASGASWRAFFTAGHSSLQAHAVRARIQALILIAALSGMWCVDQVATSAWNAANQGVCSFGLKIRQSVPLVEWCRIRTIRTMDACSCGPRPGT